MPMGEVQAVMSQVRGAEWGGKVGGGGWCGFVLRAGGGVIFGGGGWAWLVYAAVGGDQEGGGCVG